MPILNVNMLLKAFLEPVDLEQSTRAYANETKNRLSGLANLHHLIDDET